ncbi:MAG: sigma-70 family RNA polymerase sigma factor [Saprospiraceae bacterium]|nr:sigma-70 family RNA polymerase sigma factor [Saprospiraceae bacterium]
MSLIRENTDDVITSLLSSGNEQGIRLLYRYYADTMYGIIHRILPVEAEAREVLNDVFLKVYDNIAYYDASKSKLFTWMARIARNAAIDKTRSANYKMNKSIQNIDHNIEAQAQNYEAVIEDSGMTRLINALDEDLKSIIKLIYLEGYTQQDCADKLQMPLGTVKTKTRRALMLLRESLKGEGMAYLFMTPGMMHLLHKMISA